MLLPATMPSYVGRLSDEKGVMTLLQAWQQLPGIPLQAVGRWSPLGAVQALPMRTGLDIEVLGQRDPQAVLARCKGAGC